MTKTVVNESIGVCEGVEGRVAVRIVLDDVGVDVSKVAKVVVVVELAGKNPAALLVVVLKPSVGKGVNDVVVVDANSPDVVLEIVKSVGRGTLEAAL